MGIETGLTGVENGRNVTLVRQPTFHKLIRVGLPNVSSSSFSVVRVLIGAAAAR